MNLDNIGASVENSVERSVWGYVGNSVGTSVQNSVLVSVWYPVENSVWVSVQESVRREHESR